MVLYGATRGRIAISQSGRTFSVDLSESVGERIMVETSERSATID